MITFDMIKLQPSQKLLCTVWRKCISILQEPATSTFRVRKNKAIS